MSGRAAILIVNGGRDPVWGRWLELAVRKVIEHTDSPDHRIYVWNNNLGDAWVEPFLSGIPRVVALPADPAEALAHPHAAPLQRLYERARDDGADYIVTLDSDAHPLRRGWLAHLIQALDGRTTLAGIWRDEMHGRIAPYVHASCLCTTVAFIEQNRLRLDAIAPSTTRLHDTLSHFTDKARQRGLEIFKLPRTNRNNFHRVMGGIYGDLIYHHGAGSRTAVCFWDERAKPELLERNGALRDAAARLLFMHYASYIAWLQGNSTPGRAGARPNVGPSSSSARMILILGMHRTGTSCLAGCLERCGLFLGPVSRSNPHNPKGNHELPDLIAFHDRVLMGQGGSWERPPSSATLNRAQRAELSALLEPLSRRTPWGVKDPRILLLADAWLETWPSCTLVGTFRHPSAVARSLVSRNAMTPEQAYELWRRYNAELVRLHKTFRFPIIEFDLSNPAQYIETAAAIAIELGLTPDLPALEAFVDSELAHDSHADESVPASCAEVYAYLRENRFAPTPAQQDFLHGILEVKRQADWIAGFARATRVSTYLHGTFIRPLLGVGRRLRRALRG